MKILDLGCGLGTDLKKFEEIFGLKMSENDETITLDNQQLPNVKVVWDIEKIPLPFNS